MSRGVSNLGQSIAKTRMRVPSVTGCLMHNHTCECHVRGTIGDVSTLLFLIYRSMAKTWWSVFREAGMVCNDYTNEWIITARSL